MTEEQKERVRQIKERQVRSARPDRDDVPQRHSDPLARALSRELRQAQTDRGFLLSLLDSQAVQRDCQFEFEAKLLGFPNAEDRIKLCEKCLRQGIADSFVILSSALTPAEKAAVNMLSLADSVLSGMTLSPCNTPAQGFNAEREKKVATLMRDQCLSVVKVLRDKFQQAADTSSLPNDLTASRDLAAANALTRALTEMKSLTLDTQEK